MARSKSENIFVATVIRPDNATCWGIEGVKDEVLALCNDLKTSASSVPEATQSHTSSIGLFAGAVLGAVFTLAGLAFI